MRSVLSRKGLRLVALPAVAIATGLLFVPPANAVVIATPTSEADVDFDWASGLCNATGPGDSDISQPFDANGVPVTTTSSSNVTVTATGNPADISTGAGTVSTTVTASQAAGALSHVHMDSTASASVTSALGTAQTCDLEVDAEGDTSYSFDLPSPKYVTIHVTARHSTGELIFGQPPVGFPTNFLQLEIIGDHVNQVQTVLLPAGANYLSEMFSDSFADAPTPSDTVDSSHSGTVSVDLAFQDPGVATADQSGKGSKYLAFSASQSCATHQVTATWSKKAGKGKHPKVKKAVFSIGSAKATTVKKPKKGQVTTVNGVPLESSSVVTATITLLSGKTVTVSRPYLACS